MQAGTNMSNDLNKCQFIGRLGRDPEVKYLQDGRAMANIALAVGESWKDKNTGQKQEKTEWVSVVFFEPLSKIVAQYLKKGSRVYVEGKYETQKWQDQQGQDRYSTQVVVGGFAGSMIMLDSKPQQQQYQQQQPPAPTEGDDDIPF